jgi:LAGLIDADG endonuclease
MDEAEGSSPSSSTHFGHIDMRLGAMLGGFVAGEGWFSVTRRLPPFQDGTPKLRFTFGVTVATRDLPLLMQLRALLGFGSIHTVRPRQPHHQPLSTLTVASLRAHHAATIPFAETFLPACAKRVQFEQWEAALRSYESLRPTWVGRGRSRCSEPGCDGFVRGRGLCRSHYYRATGY